MIMPLSPGDSTTRETFPPGFLEPQAFTGFLSLFLNGDTENRKILGKSDGSYTAPQAEEVAHLLEIYNGMSPADLEGDMGQMIREKLATFGISTPDALMKMPPSPDFIVRMLGWPDPASENWTKEKVKEMLFGLKPPIELPPDFWDKPFAVNSAILKDLAAANGPPPLDVFSSEFHAEAPEIRAGRLYQMLSEYHSSGDSSQLPELFEALGINERVDADKLVEALFGPRDARLHREDSARNFQNFVTRLHGYAYENVTSKTRDTYESFMREHGIRDYRLDEKGDYSEVADRLLAFLKIDVKAPPGPIEYGPSHEAPDTTQDNREEWDGFTHILDENGKPIPAVFNEDGELVPWTGAV